MTVTDRTTEIRKLSHDVRNALHGVSVNLEVVRARAERGMGDPQQLLPFLDTAATQLHTVTQLHKSMTELALTMASAMANGPADTAASPET